MAHHAFKFILQDDKVLIYDRATQGVVGRVDPVITDDDQELDFRELIACEDRGDDRTRWKMRAVAPYIDENDQVGDIENWVTEVEEQALHVGTSAARGQPSHQTAVDSYLLVLEELFRRTRSGPDKAGARLAWAAMRDARIFAVPDALAVQMVECWMEAHVETDDDGEEYYCLPNPDWPRQFPFAAIWLAYCDGFSGDYDQGSLDAPNEIREKQPLVPPGGTLVGHLVTSAGDMWSVLRHQKHGELAVYCSHTPEHGWVDTIAYQEMAPLIIEYVNQQRTFICENPTDGLRRRIAQNRKKLGIKGKRIAPPPYYRIRVRSKVIKDVARRKADGMPPTYRHDVRGHERCRIRRGPLPLPNKLRETLTDGGYEIFETRPLDGPAASRMAQRGVPPKAPNEWLALKVTWISPHISPSDEDLPYVPATRQLVKPRIASERR